MLHRHLQSKKPTRDPVCGFVKGLEKVAAPRQQCTKVLPEVMLCRPAMHSNAGRSDACAASCSFPQVTLEYQTRQRQMWH